jgi:T5SS/PEP-CTERM-associated repeat protein
MSVRISSSITPPELQPIRLTTFPRRARVLVLLSSCTLLALLGFAGESFAFFYSWNNPAGGDYGNTFNWLPTGGAPPDSVDGAGFGLNATYTVDFFNDFAISAAFVSAGNVTWDLGQGSGFDHTYTAELVQVFSGAQLRFFDGRLVTDNLSIAAGGDVLVLGADKNDAAQITVTGIGSSLTHDNFLEVADYRPESVTVQNGGSVITGSGSIGADPFFGSIGTVNVIGAGSTWSMGGTNLDVGDQSEGILNITDGGAVSNHNGNIGFAEGTVNVSGAGSKWTNTGGLFIGRNTNGTLNITAGGLVTNVNGALGTDFGGHGFANVSGVGSKWTNSGQLTVGFNGEATGHLTIENGGAVSNTNGIIGDAAVFSTFAGAVGTVDVTGPGATWMNSGDLSVGRGGIGTLSVAGGGAVSNNVGFVAYAPDSEGNVAVTGAGSTWTSTGILHVGRQGDGTLRITDGGKVVSSIGQVGGTNFSQPGTGNGVITVNGPGSTWTTDNNMHIGFLGTGSLTIENGGNISDANGFLAFFTGSTGTATVTGAGSTWTNSDSLTIGSLGQGTLIIDNGGAVTNTDGHIGPSSVATGSVSVRGTSSTWNMTGDLFIGAQGTGNLTIKNGGSVSSNSGNIARAGGTPFGTGSVTVTDAGSSWTNANELRVGNNGNGTLNVRNGGRVSSTSGYIATTAGSTGAVVVESDGAKWTINGRLSVAGDASTSTSGGNGALNINPGGNVSVAQDVVIFPSGAVRLQGGTLDASVISFQGAGGQFQWTSGTLDVGIFNGNLLNQGGKLAPGPAADTTTVVGSYTQQAAGKLEIEIGGPSAFDSDIVNVFGTASLGGQLQLALIDSFTPNASQAFSVLQAANITGAFSNVANGQRLTTIDDLGSFQVNYGSGSAFSPTQVVLNNFLASLLPGDFNHDGIVNAADHVVWRKNDMGPAAFNTWRQNFGRTAVIGAGTGNATASVPEPSAIALVIVGAIGLCPRRHRHIGKLTLTARRATT